MVCEMSPFSHGKKETAADLVENIGFMFAEANIFDVEAAHALSTPHARFIIGTGRIFPRYSSLTRLSIPHELYTTGKVEPLQGPVPESNSRGFATQARQGSLWS